MSLTQKQQQKVRNAFESILRTDYISIDKLEDLTNLEQYYIDVYNNTFGLLQKQDNYISGRRGTGKTALLLRGYYECLKTISPKLKGKEHIFDNEKILPIYIDLSNCAELFGSTENPQLLEVHFIRQVIDALKSQLEVMFDENFLLVFKKENPALDDLDYIEKILVEGITLSTDKKIAIVDKTKEVENAGIKAKLVLDKPEFNGELSSMHEFEQTIQYGEVRGLNIQYFLNKINDIRKKAKIDCIYVFLDEFSDLNTQEQLRFSSLLKNLLGSKISMYFKIGVITDRYNFGEKIIIGRDIFPIPLDLNEYVERFEGIVSAMKKMQEFTKRLLEKRIEIFCPEVKFRQIFKVKEDDLYHRLVRESMGVPRTIGLILQNAWLQSEGDEIGLQEINYGVRSTRKVYFRQFEGSVKKRLVAGFYNDLWNDIIAKAVAEKNKLPDRPASHLLIDPVRKDYLNVFCENFMLHFLEESRSSKYGGNYNLYCIDYDVCLDLNIKFAEEKDQFTPIRFIYDGVLGEYDPYFVKEKLRSYKCSKCGQIYEETDVARMKVKRCFEDDTLLEEIIHAEVPRTTGNYAEVEIKILGLISTLCESEAMSAQEIAGAVGCSRQKVSGWGSKVLAKNRLINILTKNSKNYYFSLVGPEE